MRSTTLARKRPPEWWDQSRVELGEQAARLDDQLTLALALHYGRGPAHVLSLLQDVFWRLPIEIRINLLRDALWRTDLHDDVPFLEATLRGIFRIRHLLAHSVTYDTKATSLTLSTSRRGTPERTELTADELAWALLAADRCSVYFLRIQARIGDTDAWGALHGFDDPAQ